MSINLLFILEQRNLKLTDTMQLTRSIIFVVHSLGGIVVKEVSSVIIGLHGSLGAQSHLSSKSS